MSSRNELTLSRLEALSDGVIAVVLTILVLGLDVPEPDVEKATRALDFLVAMEGQLLPYFASFAIVGAFWLTQMVIFHYIQRCNRSFIWLNLVFLLFVSFNPFLTDMRAIHAGNRSLALLYGSAQVVCFILLFLIWHYAVNKLRTEALEPAIVHSIDLRIGGAILLNLLGAFLVGVDERLAAVAFVSVPFLFLMRSKADAGWQVDKAT